MSTNNGGPAFPCIDSDEHGQPYYNHLGMTLRDYFAAKALQGILADHTVESMTLRDYADWLYEMADAMLAAREAKQ